MATERDEWGKREFTYKGIFVMESFIDMITRWLKSKNFIKENKDVNEKYYIIEELPDSSYNITFEWSFENKDGDFFKTIEIKVVCVALKKQEILYNNQKITVDNGEIGISLKGMIEFDKDEKLIKNWWKKNFYKYFWKPKYGAYYKNNRDEFFKDLEKLYNSILAFFEVEGKISDVKIRPLGFKEIQQ
ncbi:MAG: hypothetical protein QXD62_01220 [Candidatus Woesearchaeota archaeon]